MSKRKATLGELEQLVLLATLRLGDSAYAVSIGDELADRAGVDVPRGSIYVTLERLERKGLLQSRFGEPTPERGGKAKRFFRPTSAARARLRAAQHALESLWDGVDLGVEKA